MINPVEFLADLKQKGCSFFTGVPDSLLKELCACIEAELPKSDHVINVNEGGAIALAMGHHLATGKVPVVYLQNSGLGNTINPLLSLADEQVYSIPMLLIIGWRGEPGVKDEPQHIKQGAVQNSLLEAMGIDVEVIDGQDVSSYSEKLAGLLQIAREKQRPVALIVRKGTFDLYKPSSDSLPESDQYAMREEVLAVLLNAIEKNAIVVSTTGKTSREVFELRHKFDHPKGIDFLTVGGMGHATQIALGIAMNHKERPVYCFDGDGAMLMHMGSAALIGSSALPNYKHVLLNNAAHDSVGGQPTLGQEIDACQIAIACNYRFAKKVTNKDELIGVFSDFKLVDGPAFLEVYIAKGARSDLGRPTSSPLENKKAFMTWVQEGKTEVK